MEQTDSWTVVEAKARFSELLERADHRGPQRVTRHGRSYAVVVGAAAWDQGGPRREAPTVLSDPGFFMAQEYCESLFPRLFPAKTGTGTVTGTAGA